jgi:hypothetical protein
LKIAIHQPNYLPWMGYIDKIANVDAFVFLDDVQYSNEGGHNRNLIKTPSGKHFLTVPVEQHLGDKINQVRTKDELSWKKKHLKSLEMNYKKASFFNEAFPVMESLINKTYGNIAEMNATIIIEWCKLFGISTKFLWSSDLQLDSAREDKVIDICCKLGADCYVSGNGARVYQVKDHFEQRGIILSYQTYEPLLYPQLWGEFIINMSAIDYIMNCGFNLPSEGEK